MYIFSHLIAGFGHLSSGINFSFQDAALLLSIIAAKLKRESGKNINVNESGNWNIDVNERKLTEKDASEVEKLVAEHLIMK